MPPVGSPAGMAGFFSGFAMLGAYVGFAIGTLALTAAFTNAFIAQLQPDDETPYQVPWPAVVVVGAIISFLLAGRDIRLLAKILLVIEGIGILSMVVLVVVIFAKGGASTTGIDFSVFTFISKASRFAAVTSSWLDQTPISPSKFCTACEPSRRALPAAAISSGRPAASASRRPRSPSSTPESTKSSPA